MEATLQGIFRERFAAHARDRKLPLRAHRAAQAIMQCRTPAMGGHEQGCPEGHHTRIQYHSCKHRSCPRCALLAKAQWVEGQQARPLACDHYHVVFTLPHELLRLWSWNRAWFADTLFQAVRETLMTLLQDARHLGALPGLVMALHTWGRTLNPHPHLHCLVTGGGLNGAGQWRAVQGGYLLPVRVVKALYKGKLLARLWGALQAGTLVIPDGVGRTELERWLKRVGEKDWNVRLQERYAHGRGVMVYLSRYVKGGPISDRRIVQADEGQTRFRYKDHRDGKTKVMVVLTAHFMERVLWHVPEPGQHGIRHYGLYAHQARSKRALCRLQLGQAPEQDRIAALDWAAFLAQFGPAQAACCPQCGQRLVRGRAIAKRGTAISINRKHGGGIVQQVAGPDAPTQLSRAGPQVPRDASFFLRSRAPVS